MSHRLVVSIPDPHYIWLEEEVKKERGLETVQDVTREIIAEAYKARKEKQKSIKEQIYERNE